MKRISFLLAVCLAPFLLQAQEKPRAWSLGGYLETLQTVWIPPGSSQWQTMGSLKNRLDFQWRPVKPLYLNIGLRNNLDYGQMVQDAYPLLGEFTSFDAGYFDLTRLWVSDSSFYFYSNLDRANLKLSLGRFEVTLGRQRINWGLNLVWTPNDIFNAFNYFDFDYAERPGCDALHAEYYTGLTSSIQVAVKIDHEDTLTAALMYRFNRWNYDFQFLGGVMEEDAVLGAGWAGQVEGAGFTGEATYFHAVEDFSKKAGVLVGSAGLNYTFKKGLFLSGSYLYNSAGTTGPAGTGYALTLFLDISAKNFTRARHSMFASVSYPVTPLISTSLATIVNPNDGSGFTGPSIDLSLTNNLSLYFIAQVFWGGDGTEYGDYGSLGYFRVKWNF
jgi:hypothetical protein